MVARAVVVVKTGVVVTTALVVVARVVPAVVPSRVVAEVGPDPAPHVNGLCLIEERCQ